MGNFTEYNNSAWFTSAMVLQVTFGLLGMFLNFMLLYAHKIDPCKLLRSSSSPFIVNIAVIDFLASLAFIVTPFLYFNLNTFTELAARLLNVAVAFFHSISFTLFLCLSAERFFSVAFPLWHRVQITTRFTRYWLAAIWLFHLTYEGILSVLLMYFYAFYAYTLCKVSLMWATFLLTQTMYFASYVSLRRQRNALYKRQDLNEASMRMIKKRLESEKQFLTTIAIVCFVLAFTLLPILSIVLVFVIFSAEEWTSDYLLRHQVTVCGLTIMTLNFAVNGLIYLWRMKKYRKTFKKLYCKCLST